MKSSWLSKLDTWLMVAIAGVLFGLVAAFVGPQAGRFGLVVVAGTILDILANLFVLPLRWR